MTLRCECGAPVEIENGTNDDPVPEQGILYRREGRVPRGLSSRYFTPLAGKRIRLILDGGAPSSGRPA